MEKHKKYEIEETSLNINKGKSGSRRINKTEETI